MRLIIQRVAQASVISSFPSIPTRASETSTIGRGLLVLVGLEQGDSEDELKAAVKEVLRLRAFEEEPETKEIMLVSQFTLFGATKGGRVSYHRAMPAQQALPLFECFQNLCTQQNENGVVRAGVFGSYMQIHLVNDGPWTIAMTASNGKCTTW